MSGFAGFDRSDYPGKAAMDWLKANTNLKWAGFYLAPAPSHQNTSWMDADDADFEGWGFAPIYLGQETAGPGSRLITAAQGTIDGAHACALMAKAGFDPKAVVYLDNEAGPPMSTAYREYVGAWCDAVVAGGFTAGVYCSFMLGLLIATLRPGTRVWVFHVPTTAEHNVDGRFFPESDPTASGFPGASIWQRDDEARIYCGAVPSSRLVVDLNSANSADPSTP
jgi:hypothetical protein